MIHKFKVRFTCEKERNSEHKTFMDGWFESQENISYKYEYDQRRQALGQDDEKSINHLNLFKQINKQVLDK